MNNQPVLPNIDTPYMIDFLTKLLDTPSPTGFANAAIELVTQEVAKYPEVQLERTKKGSLLLTLPAEGTSSTRPKRALTAHVDTLAAMVRQIKPSGRLELTEVGGFAWGSIEGENCLVHTRANGTFRGSLLPHEASVHVYENVRDGKRDNLSMEVRLDERVMTAEETRKLGIDVGDYVSFDARVEVVNGFVKSRHLDDKACVANIMTVIKSLHDANLKPAVDTCFLISNFEEVGHGDALVPAGVDADAHVLAGRGACRARCISVVGGARAEGQAEAERCERSECGTGGAGHAVHAFLSWAPVAPRFGVMCREKGVRSGRAPERRALGRRAPPSRGRGSSRG